MASGGLRFFQGCFALQDCCLEGQVLGLLLLQLSLKLSKLLSACVRSQSICFCVNSLS